MADTSIRGTPAGPSSSAGPVPGARTRKKSRHEQNKRLVVETTTWAVAICAALTVGLHAAISATATPPDVPRVTPLEYQYVTPMQGPWFYRPFSR